MDGEQLTNARTAKDKKNLSFSQKEKRKRDLGQASRGKNYVEEEKRLLRESGIYSSFDTWLLMLYGNAPYCAGDVKRGQGNTLLFR